MANDQHVILLRHGAGAWNSWRAPPYSILDLGCGPGRDLRYFRSLGHDVVGLDGSTEFVGHGTILFGMRGSPTRFPRDGITGEPLRWHLCECIAVPRAEPRVAEGFGGTLRNLAVPGVLFCSNPRGNNEEGFSGDRYSCFFDHNTWRDYVTAAGFFQVRHYYRPPGLPCHKQWWLATVWRKG